MRVIFMGTPAFAVPALQALIDSEHTIVAAYSQPPRPAGRGMKLTPSLIHQLAETHAIPVFTPTSLKSEAAQMEFKALAADIAVVAAYGLLLPQAVLDAPLHGCINIHPSALPRWRGAAPIQRTLMAGDTHTECCIIQLEAGLDTGPVLLGTPYAIAPDVNAGMLHDAMAKLGAEQMLTVLTQLASGTAQHTPQSTQGITYADKITKQDRLLHWQNPASALLNQIRGLAPSPGAVTMLGDEHIKIVEAVLEVGDMHQPPGVTLDAQLLINAVDGSALRVTRLQRPGKPMQTAAQFLQSTPVAQGTLFLAKAT